MEGVKSFIGNWFNTKETGEVEETVEEAMEPEHCVATDAATEAEEEDTQDTCETSEVCKFYLENKCRFGNKCNNRHEGVPIEKVVKKGQSKKKISENKNDKTKKKPPMKTADDVIKRLQWDPMLPKEYFTIGYLDRFLGVVEENFTTFSWEDLASVDYDVLAIPQHRIQYFKYKTEKVWDKTQRLDIMFGSTGSKVGMMEFMEEVDRKIIEERDNKLDDDDFDSDDEESGPFISLQVNSESDMHCISEEERSTHFIAIKISNPEIIENVIKVQKQMIGKEEILQDCCMKKGLLHITLAMVRIEGEEGVEEARKLMRDLKPELSNILADKSKAKIKIENLKSFGQRVVYADVTPAPDETFWKFANLVRASLDNASDLVKSSNSFDYVPHLTLAKVSRPVARERRSKYIPTSYYQEFEDLRFGEQGLDNLQLCVIDSSTRYDGFYNTLASLQFR